MYLDVLWILNFLVDLLLLIASNRLSGYPTTWKRAIFASILGGFYGSLCVLPHLYFLSGTLWRLVFLMLLGGIAFGISRDALRRSVLFVILSMSLGGVALCIGNSSFMSMLFCAIAMCFMCIFGLRGKIGNKFLLVEIQHNGRKYNFTAMVDTGNTLTDPITGELVMVISSELGQRILGQGTIDFSDPISAIKQVSGSRLIPYHSVGTDNGLLLAKRFPNVRIGKWSGEYLVAFSPTVIGTGEAYEALTGGNLWE